MIKVRHRYLATVKKNVQYEHKEINNMEVTTTTAITYFSECHRFVSVALLLHLLWMACVCYAVSNNEISYSVFDCLCQKRDAAQSAIELLDVGRDVF